MSINTVALVGRLVREPEGRKTASGTSVTSFTVAVDNGRDREAYFIDCVAWKGTADFVSTWFHKGMKVAVSGRLSTRTWEDRSGGKRKATEVVVLNVEFADGKRDDAQSADTQPAYTPPAGEFAEIEDDGDLPF